MSKVQSINILFANAGKVRLSRLFGCRSACLDHITNYNGNIQEDFVVEPIFYFFHRCGVFVRLKEFVIPSYCSIGFSVGRSRLIAVIGETEVDLEFLTSIFVEHCLKA